MRERGTRRDAGLRAASAGVQDAEVGAAQAVAGTKGLAAQTLGITSAENRVKHWASHQRIIVIGSNIGRHIWK